MITVDGSSLDNGRADAPGGWGAAVRVGSAAVEVRNALRRTCDANQHTSNRAELRAAQWALRLVRELAKREEAAEARPDVRDHRGVDASGLSLALRTSRRCTLSGTSRTEGWAGRGR